MSESSTKKKLPIIMVVDDDPQVLRAITRDIKKQYRKNYSIEESDDPDELLNRMPELINSGETVALILSDQRMPNKQGTEFLEKAKEFFPQARRVLLTAYSDSNAAIDAINKAQVHHYLFKPWDPPEEKLFPTIDEQLYLWDNEFQAPFHGLRLIGMQYSPQSHSIKDFLSGNLFPYLWLDAKTNKEAKELIKVNNLQEEDLPALLTEEGVLLKKPSLQMLGELLGLSETIKDELYDVVIIGAGPAGLAAAVYGASEGLKTLLIERRAPGGQAGTSSRIENYLGFPGGLSGAELSRRAIDQVRKFGASIMTPATVTSISTNNQYKIINLEDGRKVNAKSIVITTGVDYRKLQAKGLDSFTGAGVYYGAATTEAQAAQGGQVFVVGGGNSAGQGAVYLSKFANKVHIIIRKVDLNATMSSYLIDQINSIDNIEIVPECEISEAKGVDHLQQLVLVNCTNGELKTYDADLLFIFIGAKPVTDWIGLDVIKDSKGFIETGRNLLNYDNYKQFWKLKREPYLLETCAPGIFAAGDVRSGAMNRVASAVGEGSMAIKFIHEYLAEV